jgi:hypothetical protein
MTTTINANTSAGLVYSADTSGIVKLQSNGVTTNALAWVNFFSTTGVINASYNVSSVTVNSAGNYTIAFTTPQTDANYVGVASTTGSTSTAGGISAYFSTPTTSNVVFLTYLGTTATNFVRNLQIVIFGN